MVIVTRTPREGRSDDCEVVVIAAPRRAPCLAAGGLALVALAGDAAAERLFDGIVEQGARLPSQRRRAARRQTLANGFVRVNAALVDELNRLID